MKLVYRLLNVLIAVLLMTGLILTPKPAAASDPIPELFGPSPAADSAPAALPDPHVQRTRTAGLNPGMLDAVQTALASSRDPGPLALTLFPDARVVARFQRADHSLDGSLTLVGKLNGSPFGEIHLSRVGNALYASLNTGSSLYEIKSLDGQAVQITQVDTSRLPPEEDLLSAVNPAGAAAPVATSDVQAGPSVTDDGSRIDVYVGYTSAARAAAGSSAQIQARIATAIAETNTGYTDSGVAQQVVLVGSGEYSYTEYTGDLGWNLMLNDWSNPANDIFGPAQTARDALKADEMVLIINDTAYCGLGYLMTSGAVSPSFASSAFALVSLPCATGYYSFAHEMGHNMGAHHDRTTVGTAQGGAYPYSYGYWIPNPATGRYDNRTIMAYDTTSKYPYSSTRVNYWSNPNVILPSTGSPVGKPVNDPASAYNALTLNNTAPTVAQFRDGPGPVAPASLTASAQGAAIQLNWTFSSVDLWKFRVERSDYGLANWAEIGQTAPNVLTYTDATVAVNKDYSYRVMSDNGNGRAVSNEVSVLKPPTNLTTSLISGTRYRLTWTDNASNETGYQVERAPGGVDTWAVTPVAANTITVTDDPGPGEFRYRVRTVGTTEVFSFYSNLAYTLPNSPTGLTATAINQARINLAWTDKSTIEANYLVERSPTGTVSFVQVASLPADTSFYSDPNLDCRIPSYDYRVRASNGASFSAFTNVVAPILPKPSCTAPAAIVPLPVIRSSFSITLRWDNSDGATRYLIDKWNGTTYLVEGATDPATTTYSITGLRPSTRYQFRVIAVNDLVLFGSQDSPPTIFDESTTPAAYYLPRITK